MWFIYAVCTLKATCSPFVCLRPAIVMPSAWRTMGSRMCCIRRSRQMQLAALFGVLAPPMYGQHLNLFHGSAESRMTNGSSRQRRRLPLLPARQSAAAARGPQQRLLLQCGDFDIFTSLTCDCISLFVVGPRFVCELNRNLVSSQ